MTTQQNERTVIATFHDYGSAQHAAKELENSGVAPDAIHIDSNHAAVNPAHEKHESGIAAWWHSLFGSDSDDTARAEYEGALAGGSSVLRATVPAASIDSAMDVLNRLGANVNAPDTFAPSIRVYDQSAMTDAKDKKVRATGLSPHPITPGVQSGGAGTAGAGTLAGDETAGSAVKD